MSNKEMVKYKENIFTKLKNKILSFFKKQQPKMENKSYINEDKLEKARIMDIYEKVKANQNTLDNLTDEELYKVMLLLNEEITIVNDNVTSKVQEIENKIEKRKNKLETA